MAFTYSPSATPDDLTLTRYYVRDTVEASAMWTDDEIDMVLALKGSVEAASISLLQNRITELSNNPNMKADWLQVDWATALSALKTTLAELKQEFGLGWQLSSGGQHVYRPDSLQKEPPDYGESD